MSQGNGGWHEVGGDIGLPGRIYVRVQDVDGHLRVTEIYLDGRGEPIQAGALRRFPLGVMEEWAGRWGELDLHDSEVTPGPDLSRLATYFCADTWDRYASGEQCETCGAPLRRLGRADGRPQAVTEWPALSWLAQMPGSGVPQVPEVEQSVPLPARIAHPEEPQLSAPEHGLTDEFLSDVARAYRAAVARRQPPATLLAKKADVSVRTVQSWFLKARKRGLLEPATKRGRSV